MDTESSASAGSRKGLFWLEKVNSVFSKRENVLSFLSSRSAVSLFVIGLLLIGTIITITLALNKQLNQSHASGTITLEVDNTPQVDLTKKTVTFYVRIVPDGDIPPLIAATKIALSMNPIATSTPTPPATQQNLLSFASFTIHSPQVFPFEGSNPSFPPFSVISPSPSIAPCNLGEASGVYHPCPPSPEASSSGNSPTPTPIRCGGNTYNAKQCPSGYYCKLGHVADVGGVCEPTSLSPSPVTSTITSTPCYTTGTPGNYKPPCYISPEPVKDFRVSVNSNQLPVSNLPNSLYFSVGDQYSKSVSKDSILADLVFNINIPSTNTSLTQQDIDSYANQLKSSFTLTISFADDSQVYILNPSGNTNDPFIKSPFISQPAVFNWESIFGNSPTPTPIRCGGNTYNAKQCPSGYYCKLGPVADVGGVCELTGIKPPVEITNNISIFPGKLINSFTHNILGISFPAASVYYYYLHSWSFDQIPGFVQAVKAIQPGILRFGGSEDSTTGWDRNDCHGGVGEWYVNGFKYNRTYCPQVIDGISKFAQEVGANIVVLGINNQDGNLNMWKDFIHYIRVEKKYTNLSYFEIGNEPEGISGENPSRYSAELTNYEKALLSIDSSIHIVGPTISSIQDIANNSLTNNLSSYIVPSINAAHDAGKDLSLLSVHWYKAYHPTLDSNGITQVLRYGVTDPNTGYYLTPDDWQNGLSRRYADIFPGRINNLSASAPIPPILVDELNAVGDPGPWTVYDDNYVNSMSLADVIGRLQYNGVYGADLFTGFGQYPTDALGMIAPNNLPPQGNLPSGIFLRPTFYPYLLYSKFFGSQMIQTQVDNPEIYSVWASTDPQDPNTIKLLVVNFTNDYINPNIHFDQFQPQQAKIYTVESSNPTNVSQDAYSQNADITINGQKLDPMNVEYSLNKISPKIMQFSSNDSTIKSFLLPAYSISSVVISGMRTSTGTTSSLTPSSVSSTPIPSTVTYQMIIACLDLKKPISDPTSNYNSDACKAFSNRAYADLNHDGWINQVDLNIYLRAQQAR